MAHRLAASGGSSHQVLGAPPLTHHQLVVGTAAPCRQHPLHRSQALVAYADVKEAAGRRTSKRLQQLQELADISADDGWSVQPVNPPAPPPVSQKQPTGAAATAKPVRLGRKAVQAQQLQQTQAAAAAKTAPQATQPAKPKKPGKTRTPYVNLQSEAGAMGMALLSARLQRGEGGALSPEELQQMRTKVSEARAAQAGQGVKGDTLLQRATAAAAVRLEARRKKVVYVDDDGNVIGTQAEEEAAEDVTDKPLFSLTLGETDTEFAEYDREGNIVNVSRTPVLSDDPLGDLEGEEEDMDFGAQGSSWGALGRAAAVRSITGPDTLGDDSEDIDTVTGLPRSTQEMERLLGEEGAAGSGALLWGSEREEEQSDWGLEEIKGTQSTTLMEELGVVKRRKGTRQPRTPDPSPSDTQDTQQGTLLADEAAVQWGGTGLSLPGGADLELQEALLSRMFKPHKVKALLEHQKEAYQASLELQRGGTKGGKYGEAAKLQRALRIVSGTAANKKLLSSKGSQTRPMMEKVRSAIFSMILSRAGTPSGLPPNTRWLDLFAGTGSVGLEALSRGAGTCHFVEFDPWTCRKVLGQNISHCGFNKQSVMHTGKVEGFLQRARDLPRYAGGAFDFISMCPPYLLVSYPQLFELLEGSPLIHEGTIMFVEYPKQLSHEIPEQVSGLHKVRDRKYGRTWVAVYAAPSAGELTDVNSAQDDWDEELEM